MVWGLCSPFGLLQNIVSFSFQKEDVIRNGWTPEEREIDTFYQMVSTELIYIIHVFECKVLNLVDVVASNQTVSIKCHCLTKAGSS